MAEHVLCIGGTRFLGRHTVQRLREHDYELTLFTRGRSENPFADAEDVSHVRGDRTDDDRLREVAGEVDPDAVVDFVAYHPGEVRTATEVFADVDAYVFVSSGAAYGAEELPKREGETALEPCSAEQATDDTWETYGARKAEGDRAVFEAAEAGVNAMSIRPTVVYGPHDYTDRVDYWLQRVTQHDRVLVPGDGTFVWHLVSVEAVARGIHAILESGSPGEAYNVGDRRLLTLREFVETLAEIAGTDVEVVTAGARELAAGDLEPTDFPLYGPYPHVLETEKLHALGWRPPEPEDAIAETVAAYQDAGRDRGTPERGPERDAEGRVLDVLATVG